MIFLLLAISGISEIRILIESVILGSFYKKNTRKLALLETFLLVIQFPCLFKFYKCIIFVNYKVK